MSALFSRLLLICLWRAGPQDLPYAPRVLWQLLALLVLLNLIGAERAGLTAQLPGRLLLSFGFLLLPIYLLLLMRGLRQRFVQTAMAFAGAGLLFGLAALPLLWLLPTVQQMQAADFKLSAPQAAASLTLMVLTAWKVAVDAHIWRHALQCSPLAAAALAIALLLAEIVAGQRLFGAG